VEDASYGWTRISLAINRQRFRWGAALVPQCYPTKGSAARSKSRLSLFAFSGAMEAT
jgi:hypothetical protein